jgi:hypothetical protein
MRTILMLCAVVGVCAVTVQGQSQPQPRKPDADVQALVSRLDLERYKATVKGLTQFGDRRQGTERNRKAVDWIEAQLKSYGCPTERLKYEYNPPPPAKPGAGGGGGGGGAAGQRARPDPTIATGEVRTGPGGSRYRGVTRQTGVNNNPDLQPDEKLRELNREPAVNGPREQVYCTKVGTTRPNEMYIIGAHMDGHGWGEAANDNGSGTALVMELARILSMPDVTSDVTIRFALWNNGTERRARVRRSAPGAPGQGRSCRLRPISGAALARDDSARHDDVGSRHAAPGRHLQSRAASRSGRQHRVPVAVEARGRFDEAGVSLPLREREVRD